MTADLWSGRLDASNHVINHARKYWCTRHTSTKATCNGSCHVIYEWWSGRTGEVASLLLTTMTMEVNTPAVNYCMFTATDVVHLRRLLSLVFEVWPAHCDGWHLSPHSWILLHWRSAFITADCDPIHLNRQRSDSNPIIVRSQTGMTYSSTEMNLVRFHTGFS